MDERTHVTSVPPKDPEEFEAWRLTLDPDVMGTAFDEPEVVFDGHN